MAHKTVQATSEASASISRSVSHEDIERRAYQRYCDRGCTSDGDLDDWLEAERELLSERTDAHRAESSRQPQDERIPDTQQT